MAERARDLPAGCVGCKLSPHQENAACFDAITLTQQKAYAAEGSISRGRGHGPHTSSGTMGVGPRLEPERCAARDMGRTAADALPVASTDRASF